jgi:glycerophosphoryl diester phosphodiesterase
MTWVVAHRGGTERFAGNSLDAFADAVAAGVDMIEFDVRRTADGALVVAHDDTVGQRTLAELDSVVTLERLFALTSGRVRLDVELKERGCAQGALDLALAQHEPGQLVVTSFDPVALREARAGHPEIAAGYIVEDADALAALDSLDVDYIVPSADLVAAGLLHRLDLPALVWTVNEEDQMARLLNDARVAGLITDHPHAALALIGNRRPD